MATGECTITVHAHPCPHCFGFGAIPMDRVCPSFCACAARHFQDDFCRRIFGGIDRAIGSCETKLGVEDKPDFATKVRELVAEADRLRRLDPWFDFRVPNNLRAVGVELWNVLIVAAGDKPLHDALGPFRIFFLDGKAYRIDATGQLVKCPAGVAVFGSNPPPRVVTKTVDVRTAEDVRAGVVRHHVTRIRELKRDLECSPINSARWNDTSDLIQQHGRGLYATLHSWAIARGSHTLSASKRFTLDGKCYDVYASGQLETVTNEVDVLT